MEWNIIFDEAFRDWLYEQEETVQDSILAYIGLLKQKGPLLGRPYVDTLQGRGNKTGDKRWYEKNIPIAEKRFEAYLKTLTEQNL